MTNREAIEYLESIMPLLLESKACKIRKSLQIAVENLSDNQDKKLEAFDIVRALDRLKEENGNQTIIVETPNGSLSLKLKDALIYEGCCGEIVIDSE